MAVSFHKYEGAGNDFIIIDNRAGTFGALEEIVRALCDRRFGIGADGLMLLEEDREAQFRMRYFNSDGPEATMCGNGGRCMALFARHLEIGDKRLLFNGPDGPHEADIIGAHGESGTVSLLMGHVAAVETMGDGFFADTGSPHFVMFTDDVDAVDVFGEGRKLRNSEMLAAAGGANINFVQRTGAGSVKIRTYERGVEDETLACGTGAVAAALAFAQSNDMGEGSVKVAARGGDLEVSFRRTGGGFHDIWLTGPARRVFSGEFLIENFLSK